MWPKRVHERMRAATPASMIGQRFGSLVVSGGPVRRGAGRESRLYWLCTCDCGRSAVAKATELRSGRKTRCGSRHGVDLGRVKLAVVGVPGAIAAAARRIGCSPDDYMAHVECGLSWCSYHRAWHPGAEFGSHMGRPTGAQPDCLAAMVAIRKARRAA
jgi:hypothetical protein